MTPQIISGDVGYVRNVEVCSLGAEAVSHLARAQTMAILEMGSEGTDCS